jgi:8-oxo-dGTP pyrophosphatase MutT (NUDIX family)
MVKQMTTEEKTMLKTWEFDDLWRHTWKQEPRKIASEEAASCEKFYTLRNNGNLNKLLDNNDNPIWSEPEWGFPKGRREHGETDLECALREFCEETGLEACKTVENIMPYEEIFMGSNYKSYKHKYFLMKIDYKENQDAQMANNEIGAMCWMPFLTAMNAIRPYNLERRKILISVNTVLTKYLLV